MSDARMREWLEDVSRRHGLTGVAIASGGGGRAAAADPLLAEYERLGGDAELLKALADEDRAFRSQLELQRARAKDWQRDRKSDLEMTKAVLEQGLTERRAFRDAADAFLEREASMLERLSADVRALGDKLDTEPGRELLHRIGQGEARIRAVRTKGELNHDMVEVGQRMFELVVRQLEDVELVFEAIEQRIRDSRSEIDNALELRAMSLQEKIERLRGGPKRTRRKALERLDADIARVLAGTAADYRKERATHHAPEKAVLDPIDWGPVEEGRKALAARTLDELRADDPARERLARRYEKAGGDAGLLRKRMRAWKRAMAAAVERAPYQGHEEEWRERAVEASTKLLEAEDELRTLRSERARLKDRARELNTAAGSGSLLSQEDAAEYQLMARGLERLEKDIAHSEALIPTLQRSKENAELFVDTVRRLSEYEADDDTTALPRPSSEDLDDVPLRAKYAELLGRG